MTEVKIFEYNESTDIFNCTVNDVQKEISGEHIANAHQVMRSNWDATADEVPQSEEDLCLAMCFENHFQDCPQQMCYTFYRVNF